MIQTVKMYESLMAADCLVRPMYFNGNSEQEAELLSKSKLDGVIWQLPMRKHMSVLRMFKACNVPVISTFPSFISGEFDCIALDYYKCGYTVAKYLLGRGHRNILYINKNPSDVEAVKKAGCMAAFAEFGVEWQERLWHCDENGFSEAKVKSILKHSGDFSAINCHTLHVNCVKHELADRQDVQIIHNIHCKVDVVREGMPGILIPAAQAGAMAVDMLLDMIKQPELSVNPRQVLLESKIIEPENI
jgi:DNA-binding LacI/PurR family transcriptional regulator